MRYLPSPRDQCLYPLNLSKSFGKTCLWVVEASYAVTEQEVCGRIQGVSRSTIQQCSQGAAHRTPLPKEQVLDIHLLSLSAEFAQEDQGVFLKDFKIAHPILDELWANQLPRLVPFLMIRGEDAWPVISLIYYCVSTRCSGAKR